MRTSAGWRPAGWASPTRPRPCSGRSACSTSATSARPPATRDAVAHYRSLPDAGHDALAQDALAWRDLTAIPDSEDALARIDGEIRDLHVEVFRRLGARAEIPRHDELRERADQIEPAT